VKPPRAPLRPRAAGHRAPRAYLHHPRLVAGDEVFEAVFYVPGCRGDLRILTSRPSGLQGLSRYGEDTGTSADYIVVEMAQRILGPNWMEQYVAKANAGG
jgi:hypothetical protein